MLKINRKIEYSLIVLKHMYDDNKKEILSVKHLSQIYNIPISILSKIMQKLSNLNILDSVQGINGGYKLNTNYNNLWQTSLMDFFEMILGKIEVVKCFSNKKKPCGLINMCNVISPIATLADKFKDFFSQISLEIVLNYSTHEKEIEIKKNERLHS